MKNITDGVLSDRRQRRRTDVSIESATRRDETVKLQTSSRHGELEADARLQLIVGLFRFPARDE